MIGLEDRIKWRGKGIPYNDWKYGQLEIDHNNAVYIHYCIDKRNIPISNEVIKSTIGQYTGFKDKNGKEIYEGDIVEKHYTNYGDIEEFICKWIPKFACFAFIENKLGGEYAYFQKCDESKLNIIGNIYDNPNLIDNND